MLPEIAVFSGDTVRKDAEGFLYFIGRRDEMIKTSGYRVSPTEVEEILYATQAGRRVRGLRRRPCDARPGDPVSSPRAGRQRRWTCRRCSPLPQHMPAYMVPAGVDAVAGPLPRNPNGKIDRKLLATQWVERHD
jgi:acyl-coenzyme A synthetase/AMP-(fatty) acid ligase